MAAASSLAISFQPALSRYRLAVLDQRGTGESGVLDCPNLQRLRSLDAFPPTELQACANRIGPNRAFYTTADTVLDIDALRQSLGADKIALSGISYGTHVALQYARAFPRARQQADPRLDRRARRPRRLPARHLPQHAARADEQCANGACRDATSDPVADVAALVARINASGPLRGSYYDAHGRKRADAVLDARRALRSCSPPAT